jgi:hypothetical protein
MTRPQAISALNFAALLVHQFEEYVEPGWFPGQFNVGLFKSDSPRNYPLNPNTATLINVAIGYPFYIAPILFPRTKWLGIPPVLFGMAQAVGHGVIFPKIAGDRYSPGFLASILLHVPLGIAYMRALQEEGPIPRKDLVRGVALGVVFAASGVGAPNLILKDRNSPFAFTHEQMGRYER